MAQRKKHAPEQATPKGPNNPAKSVPITTGTFKKKDTYRKQAAEHKGSDARPEAAKNEWNEGRQGRQTSDVQKRAQSESEDKARADARDNSDMPAVTALPGDQHPEQWRADLNPNALAGQNAGPAAAQEEKEAATAYDLKEVHRRLQDLSDDELKQIPVLSRGSRLHQGATYLDLKEPDRGPFTATGNMEAGRQNWYVPKSELDYELWNRLIGVDDPARLGTA